MTPAIELTTGEIALAVACMRLQLATLESQGAHSDTRYLAQARDLEALIAKLEGVETWDAAGYWERREKMEGVEMRENSIFYNQRPDFSGQQFRVTQHDCIWTVIRYARGGNWVCQEPDHGTTCQFHESEILAGMGEYAFRDEIDARHTGEHFETDREEQ